jgi:RHS repeat-associated protein
VDWWSSSLPWFNTIAATVDGDTGLVYLRSRVYDPATAQFLSVDPIAAITRAPYTYAEDNPAEDNPTLHGDRTGLGSGFEAELPEGVPCIPPFCVPPSVHEGFENAFECVEHGAETVWSEITENEGPNDEGAEALKERQAKEAACPPPDGNQLRREGEDILGRGHNPAKRQPWNEWWKQLNREAKKAYDRANGPRPRKGT